MSKKNAYSQVFTGKGTAFNVTLYVVLHKVFQLFQKPHPDVRRPPIVGLSNSEKEVSRKSLT